jgi:ABC-type transporter Mla subunit MlaD
VADLRGIFKRFAPLNRDTKEFATLLAARQRDIRGSIHNLNQVTNALGSVNRQLASLIESSNTNFRRSPRRMPSSNRR